MKILTVSESSTGAELGLKPGDKIESICCMGNILNGAQKKEN